MALKKSVLYGPVNSRRLGRSLGINVLSSEIKICFLNCLYCQYGHITVHQEELFNESNFLPVAKIVEAVKAGLSNQYPLPDYITFSGNGEATLHPAFPYLVDAVIKLRDQYCPQTKTAILSNGTQVLQKPVRDAINKLDQKIVKLDCAEIGLFIRYNRPVIKFDFEKMIAIFQTMPNLLIQSLFTGGLGGNYYSEHLEIWLKTIAYLKPVMVQIYSLDRGYQSDKITSLTRDAM